MLPRGATIGSNRADDDVTQVTAGGSISRNPVHRPDQSTSFDTLWEAEWNQLRLREALARVKR